MESQAFGHKGSVRGMFNMSIDICRKGTDRDVIFRMMPKHVEPCLEFDTRPQQLPPRSCSFVARWLGVAAGCPPALRRGLKLLSTELRLYGRDSGTLD